MSEQPVVMTQQALDDLEVEIERLETVERRAIAERIKTAREFGDLKENADYHDAKNVQAHLETRILVLRDKRAKAVVREAASGGVIGLGSVVEVHDTKRDKRITYTLVPSTEADAGAGKVSIDSPLGRALDGRRQGQRVSVPTPKGARDLSIESIG